MELWLMICMVDVFDVFLCGCIWNYGLVDLESIRLGTIA